MRRLLELFKLDLLRSDRNYFTVYTADKNFH